MESAMTFKPVDSQTWPDMAALFEAKGGPKYCWCMAWRDTSELGQAPTHQDRKSLMERRVTAGIPVGILAYRDGVPVGWCSIAPRDTYSPLGGIEDADSETVWSLVCFYVPRSHRGQGIFARLLDAAVDHAAARGATVVEAYPVDPDSPSYRFGGFVASFEAAGFEEVGRAGKRRHVLRRRVK